jgi:L-cystine uptake protein TcyP (sodium:dicarboxylate symporter family)
MKPLQTGVALAITVSIFYSMCTLVMVLAPESFMTFMNSLFHGIDFTSIKRAPTFSWAGYFYALSVMTIWALAMGAFFAWVFNGLSYAGWTRREWSHWHKHS